MALKDLVAQKSALTEESIERIVKEFVRYDPDEREIAFTPEFARLSNKAKILVYMVALQGWPFVLDESLPTEAKPADIESQLGIAGGTLRPLLKELKERHLLAAKGGSYTVRAASLDAIQKELPAPGSAAANPTSKTRQKKKSKTSQPRSIEENEKNAEGSRPKPAKKGTGGGAKEITLKFNQWVDQGYFDDGRTLGEVQSRFHQEAIILPQTSIPKYLLAAVRDERLSRTMQDVNGKQRWVYRTKQ